MDSPEQTAQQMREICLEGCALLLAAAVWVNWRLTQLARAITELPARGVRVEATVRNKHVQGLRQGRLGYYLDVETAGADGAAKAETVPVTAALYESARLGDQPVVLRSPRKGILLAGRALCVEGDSVIERSAAPIGRLRIVMSGALLVLTAPVLGLLWFLSALSDTVAAGGPTPGWLRPAGTAEADLALCVLTAAMGVGLLVVPAGQLNRAYRLARSGRRASAVVTRRRQQRGRPREGAADQRTGHLTVTCARPDGYTWECEARVVRLPLYDAAVIGECVDIVCVDAGDPPPRRPIWQLDGDTAPRAAIVICLVFGIAMLALAGMFAVPLVR